MKEQVIAPSQFADALKKILEEDDEEKKKELNAAGLAEAKQTVKEVKAEAKAKFGKGDYSTGWTKKTKTKNGVKTFIVWNRKAYRLAHLLEFGHSKWLWGKETGGRVQGIKHIKPVEEKAVRRYEAAIREVFK